MKRMLSSAIAWEAFLLLLGSCSFIVAEWFHSHHVLLWGTAVWSASMVTGVFFVNKLTEAFRNGRL